MTFGKKPFSLEKIALRIEIFQNKDWVEKSECKMGKNRNKKKQQNQSSSGLKNSMDEQSEPKRTEEDIRNDDKELAHFRDVFILHII